jgi:hypothetical protein
MGNRQYTCKITAFERRLYCNRKISGKGCLKPSFLRYRCPNLIYEKEDVMKAAKKGIKEIVTPAGFTEEAKRYVKKYRPELQLIQDYLTTSPK